MAELGRFSPLVEPVSIDEAYVDITGCDKLYGSPEKIGRDVKRRIREAVGLTCSVGVAPVKFLAEQLEGDIMAYRELVIGNAGELARARLERVHKELKDLLAQALKVKFETLNAQKSLIEEGGSGGKGRRAAIVEPFVDAEHMRWPFRGEYWKDELDSYLFIIQSECRE